jgi:hypothetical protein
MNWRESGLEKFFHQVAARVAALKDRFTAES